MTERWATIRPRVKRREREFIETHGPCAHCGATQSLEVFWRDLSVKRPTKDMVTFWIKSDVKRRELEPDLMVLCHVCMTRHKYGLEHGGGVAGIKGCDCDLCTLKRQEYMRGRMKVYRQRKKEGRISDNMGRSNGTGSGS